MSIALSSFAPATTASATQPRNIEQLRAQAEELESVFLNTLIKQMFSGIKTDQSSFGGGFAEETWRGMQSEQLANQIAQSGGLGIAESLTRTYQPIYAPWLGANFDVIVPYLIMIIVLMVRPYGLFGTKEVVRV